jgi:hypothetical protein
MTGSYSNDNPWKTVDSDFPADGTRSDQLAFCINFAVLAPSIHNSQPWLFTLLDDSIELYADRSRLLTASDPDGREMLISCGAALTNLVVAIQYFGYEVSVQYLPDQARPDLLARIRVGRTRQPDHVDDSMFRSIRRRRSIRRPFQPRPVPRELQRRLIWIAMEYGCWLYFVESSEDRERISGLVEQAHQQQLSNVAYQAERAAWIGLGDPSRRNGNSAPSPLDWETMGVRNVDSGQHWLLRDRELLRASPAVFVLGTGGDTPMEWIQAGEALQRMLLRAEMEGVSASFLNQPIQIADLRAELQQITGRSGPPQLLIRMGYATGSEPTSRRPVSEVLRSPMMC